MNDRNDMIRQIEDMLGADVSRGLAERVYDALRADGRIAYIDDRQGLGFVGEVDLIEAATAIDRVTVGNWTGPIAVARNLMDDEIAESLHLRVSSEQEFVDRYCAAHAAKYGTDFVVS